MPAPVQGIRCERLLWSWNQVTLAETGAGYGPVQRSAGWPFKDRSDSTGGLGSRTRYLSPGAESLLTQHPAPAALSLTVISEGHLLVRKEFLGEDAFGRNSRWLVYAVLDPAQQLHPADVLAAQASGLLHAEVDKGGIAVRTDLPALQVPHAPPPLPNLDLHEQLLTRLLPGLMLVRQEPTLGPIVVWARSTDDVTALLTSLIAVLPRAFSAALTFSTFDAKPGRAGCELVGAIEPFSLDPRQEPDQLWIDLVESATNLPPPAPDEQSVATELLDAARSGQRPPDDVAAVEELVDWARSRAVSRAAAQATSQLRQGLSLGPGVDPVLIDAVISQGEQLPDSDRLLWLGQPGVAQRASQGWSPMAKTLAIATIRGDGAWYEPFDRLLFTYPAEIARLLDELMSQHLVEDGALLALARGLPIKALPGLFDILVAGNWVHSGFLLFDVLGDPRLDDDRVRQAVLEPLLAAHWPTLGPAANIPPAVVASLTVRGAGSGTRRLPAPAAAASDGEGGGARDSRPVAEGLRRWLPGRH
jgi:GTPase-associated protein 1, middle domain